MLQRGVRLRDGRGEARLATRDVRGKVMSAAKRVFPRKGYSATTVADIIGKAGIARATFYKYFPNKRQVFFELFMENRSVAVIGLSGKAM